MELRIIQSTVSLFLRLGIRSVTMDDIANELGISKKTIYQYFSDKTKLVDSVTQHMLEEEKNRALDIYKIANNPIEEIVLSTKFMKEMIQNINAILFYELKKFYPNSWDRYVNFKSNFLDIIERNLNEGISQNLYRKEIKTHIIAILRVETIDLAFNLEAFPANKHNVLEIQLESIDLFLRGIVTKKGLEIYENMKIEI